MIGHPLQGQPKRYYVYYMCLVSASDWYWQKLLIIVQIQNIKRPLTQWEQSNGLGLGLVLGTIEP